MGDGRAEGLSAIGDGGQAAISLTPDADGTHIHIFESSKLEGSYVGGLLYTVEYESGVQGRGPCQKFGPYQIRRHQDRVAV